MYICLEFYRARVYTIFSLQLLEHLPCEEVLTHLFEAGQYDLIYEVVCTKMIIIISIYDNIAHSLFYMAFTCYIAIAPHSTLALAKCFPRFDRANCRIDVGIYDN